jgi:hypothetical protein
MCWARINDACDAELDDHAIELAKAMPGHVEGREPSGYMEEA